MIARREEELEVGGRGFRFALCRKAERMGAVAIDHWWMDTATLYGQRNQPAANLDPIVDSYWALCRHHGTDAEASVRESYVLAKLLPRARSHASRRVFNDAHLFSRGRATRTARARAIEDLERLLGTGRDDRLTPREFKEETAKVLGPPRPDGPVAERYEQFAAELLGESCEALDDGDTGGLELAFRRWDEAMLAWGRRRGFALEKRVLDILSYECRTALHRCYSSAWCELLPRLTERYGLDEASQDFLGLWHLDQIQNPERDFPDRFHLFHGHVFGLHPAGALLLQTRSGRERVADWLAAAGREAAFGRLLNALMIAVHHYAGLHEAIAADRRSPQPLADVEEQAAARAIARKTGRRRPGRGADRSP